MRLLTLVLMLLTILIQVRLWAPTGVVMDIRRLSQDVRFQSQEYDRLSQRNATLEADVIDLKRGGDAIEQRARTELGMIRNGEIFYQVVRP